ncbi:homogentisate 1,2-dioxygenase [Sphingomonas sp. ZT3P38]|uniref:homogentisate 1,2-dioxygenase n=1 Tax=Parasphingomonas zepuensis TaxID=3096161 RepID=UPI002FCB2DF1
MRLAPLIALAMIGAIPSNAAAQEATCPVLPLELAGWASPSPVVAATTAADLPRAIVTIGRRADLALSPSAKIVFAVAPGKAPAATTNSGMAGFTVAAAGTYRVALGTAAWITIAKDGAVLQSVAHKHGLGCAGVRKMVDFTLTPGAYVLQIEGAPATVAAVLIARLP